MSQETLEGIPNTKVSTEAINIVRDNLPEWFKANLWNVVQVCIDHEDWCERLVEKDQIDLLFTNDIAHDISGLLQKDEHFLPRI